MAHSPLGILDISLIAGNDVNMHMQDTLPGRWPDINADIVAIGVKLSVQQAALLTYQRHACIDLFCCQVKKAGDMTTRDHQSMPRTHRVAVASTVGKFVLQ